MTNQTSPEIVHTSVFWFCMTTLVGAIISALYSGCTPAQRAQALTIHDAACVPVLVALDEFISSAERHGVDPTAAARSICAVPRLAEKLAEPDAGAP